MSAPRSQVVLVVLVVLVGLVVAAAGLVLLGALRGHPTAIIAGAASLLIALAATGLLLAGRRVKDQSITRLPFASLIAIFGCSSAAFAAIGYGGLLR